VFEKAIALLHEEEKTMHLALCYSGTNPLSKLSTKVLDVLRRGKQNRVDLLLACRSEYNQMSDLDEVLEYLATTKQVGCEIVDDDVTNEKVPYWHLLKESSQT